MFIQITEVPATDQCQFVPLAVLGYCLTQRGTLEPVWSRLSMPMKTRTHQTADKLQDILVALLAGCRSLAQVNLRIRPDRMLAAAWQRSQFAEQSSLSRTLDALESTHLEQLRDGQFQLLRQYSRIRYHDWSHMLMLDVDSTSLLTSKRAEGSQKGWVSGKKTTTVAMCCGLPWLVSMRASSRWRTLGIGTPMSIFQPR